MEPIPNPALFRKSSFSGNSQNNCVEVATVDADGDA
jgi:hypothetical protein